MSRSIHALIRAVFAGDTITQAEATRLIQHVRKANRQGAVVRRQWAPEAFERDATGDEFEEFRGQVLRELPTYSRGELHALVRKLLTLLGVYFEFQMMADGLQRRTRTQTQRAQQDAAAKRRRKTDDVRDAIAALRRSGLTPTQAVRRYLRDADPDWRSATDAEKARKVDALARRLRGQPSKKSGR